MVQIDSQEFCEKAEVFTPAFIFFHPCPHPRAFLSLATMAGDFFASCVIFLPYELPKRNKMLDHVVTI
jgi:hypothetical protein